MSGSAQTVKECPSLDFRPAVIVRLDDADPVNEWKGSAQEQ